MNKQGRLGTGRSQNSKLLPCRLSLGWLVICQESFLPFRTGTGIIKPLAEGEQRCGFGRDPWESASVAASDLLWLLWQGEQTNSTGVKIS